MKSIVAANSHWNRCNRFMEIMSDFRHDQSGQTKLLAALRRYPVNIRVQPLQIMPGFLSSVQGGITKLCTSLGYKEKELQKSE